MLNYTHFVRNYEASSPADEAYIKRVKKLARQLGYYITMETTKYGNVRVNLMEPAFWLWRIPVLGFYIDSELFEGTKLDTWKQMPDYLLQTWEEKNLYD